MRLLELMKEILHIFLNLDATIRSTLIELAPMSPGAHGKL